MYTTDKFTYLQLTGLKRTDAGVLKCKLKNSAGQAVTTTDLVVDATVAVAEGSE